GQVAESHLEVTALVVELAHPEPAHHLLGLVPGVDRHAAVALPERVRVVTVVTVGHEAGVHELVLLRFRFLQADDVRVLRTQPFEKSLACGGADAVDVERDYPEQASSLEEPFVVPSVSYLPAGRPARRSRP